MWKRVRHVITGLSWCSRHPGILGNDVYDKLMLLRALRPLFPEAVFFTTDLDARLLHPKENEWARNLIVASGYGFQLRTKETVFREQTAEHLPFRSCYQTALYASTLLALRGIEGDAITKFVQGQVTVYEIGRTRAYELSEQGAPDSSWVDLRSRNGLFLGIALLFTLAMIIRQARGLCHEQRLRNLAPDAVFLGALAVVLLVLLWLRGQELGPSEPFLLFEGISAWPSELLRLAATLLAFHLLVKAQSRLERNAYGLSAEFGLNERLVSSKELETARPLLSRVACYFREDWRSADIASLWQMYRGCEARPFRWLRVALSSGIYILFGTALFASFSRPLVPHRGQIDYWADRLLLVASTGALVVLTFYVMDATVACERFIRTFTAGLGERRSMVWPEAWNGESAGVLRAIDLIARRTEVVGKLVPYPFIVLILVIFARSTYFERWGWPVPLILIWSVNSILVICSALILNQPCCPGSAYGGLLFAPTRADQERIPRPGDKSPPARPSH